MKMSRLNPYLQLLIRMSLVLVVVVAVAVFYNADADASADETDPAALAAAQNGTSDDITVPDGKDGITLVGSNEPGKAGNMSDAGNVGDVGSIGNAGNVGNVGNVDNAGAATPGTDAADTDVTTASETGTGTTDTGNTDVQAADRSGGDPEGNGDGTGNDPGTGETAAMEYASDNGTQDEINGSEQKAEIKNGTGTADADKGADDTAAKLAEYKKTQEYVDSLLVTHPDHYNAEVVKNARSLPLASDNDRYLFITGKDKQIYKVGKMPEGFKSDAQTRKHMVTLDVPVWKMTKSGEKYSSYWPITINEKLADSIRCIFSDIYQLDIKFPFNYLTGYSYRKVNGVGLVYSKLMSTHAFGVALDINLGDFDNDYFLGKGNDLRNKNNPYCIPDEVIAIFEDYGWFWGGNYDICADTMHFQYFELGFLQYDSDEPFPILSYDAQGMDPAVIRNLTQRLVKLGYLDKETQNFSKKVDKAVKKFQEDHGLEPDGVVNYATWEPLINLTHYMKYVF